MNALKLEKEKAAMKLLPSDGKGPTKTGIPLVDNVYRDNDALARISEKRYASAQHGELDEHRPILRFSRWESLPWWLENTANFEKNKSKMAAALATREKAVKARQWELAKEWNDKKQRWIRPFPTETRRKRPSDYPYSLHLMPDLVLNETKQPRFVNTNSCIEDPTLLDRQRKYENVWTEGEKRIFLQKFTAFPKDFRKIASFLHNKTGHDCVMYYYQNKRQMNLKKIVRNYAKQQQQMMRQPLYASPRFVDPKVPRELRNLGITELPEDYEAPAAPTRTSPVKREPSEEKRVESPKVSRTQKPKAAPKAPRPPAAVTAAAAAAQAAASPGRTSRTSRGASYSADFFGLDLDSPILSSTKWVERERELMGEAITKWGLDFDKIAMEVGTKDSDACQKYFSKNKKHFSQFLPAEQRTSTWTTREGEQFVDLLKAYGKQWKLVASAMATKTATQVRLYYQQKREEWNLDEIIPPEPEVSVSSPTKRRRPGPKPGSKRTKLQHSSQSESREPAESSPSGRSLAADEALSDSDEGEVKVDDEEEEAAMTPTVKKESPVRSRKASPTRRSPLNRKSQSPIRSRKASPSSDASPAAAQPASHTPNDPMALDARPEKPESPPQETSEEQEPAEADEEASESVPAEEPSSPLPPSSPPVNAKKSSLSSSSSIEQEAPVVAATNPPSAPPAAEPAPELVQAPAPAPASPALSSPDPASPGSPESTPAPAPAPVVALPPASPPPAAPALDSKQVEEEQKEEEPPLDQMDESPVEASTVQPDTDPAEAEDKMILEPDVDVAVAEDRMETDAPEGTEIPGNDDEF